MNDRSPNSGKSLERLGHSYQHTGFGAEVSQARTNPEAVRAGISYVLSMWHDGHWADCNLSSGESDVWVTAYVAARLGELPSEYLSFAARQKTEDSLDWLLKNRNSNGGWGFTSKSASDADSSAWAMLALRRHGRAIPAESYEFICRCRRPDGGFALHPENGLPGQANNFSAPDVTAVAMNAAGGPDAAGVNFLANCWLQTSRPLPPVRLVSRFYTCSAVLDWDTEKVPWPLMNKICELMSFYDAESAFEQALLLRCLGQLRIQKAWSVAAGLRRIQEADGGWPASAVVLTEPSQASESHAVPGLDHKRILTTMTSVSALAHVSAQQGLYFGSDRPLPQRLTLESFK